jgi:hypothetical protein
MAVWTSAGASASAKSVADSDDPLFVASEALQDAGDLTFMGTGHRPQPVVQAAERSRRH